MSLVGTLGKLAIGAIAAKGIGKLMSGGAGGQQGGGLGSLGGLLGGLGGGGQQQGGGLGALGGLLGGLGGSGAGGSSGGLGGLMDALGGGQQQQGGGAGGIGDLLNQALGGQSPNQIQATPEQDQQAEILLRAMISAAKADGQIDEGERKKITEQLGNDVSPEEMELVRRELSAPLDVEGLIRSVPQGMEQQVYLMSLLAIDLDSKPEAVYLDQLAKGMNISPQQANAIHEQLGAPTLYS